MKFAAFTTIAVAIAAAPFAAGIAASGKMNEAEFVTTAQCVALAEMPSVTANPADVASYRARLSFEQNAQPAEAVARARAEIRAVGRLALSAAPGDLQDAYDAACGASTAAIAHGSAREEHHG